MTEAKRCTWKVRHGLEALTKLPDEPTADKFEAECRAAARAFILSLLERWREGKTRAPSLGQQARSRRHAPDARR